MLAGSAPDGLPTLVSGGYDTRYPTYHEVGVSSGRSR